MVEMLRGAGLGCEITAVTITGGEREQQERGLSVSVPKRDLIAGVQVLLEQGSCGLRGGCREAGSLVRELMDVRMTMAGPAWAGCGLGADGCGEHDDLVIALALACWRANRKEVGERGQRLL